MPLISRVREWIARRNADITYGGAEAAGLAWIVMWPIVLILLPVLLFLVLVGLVYEGLVRIDRQRRLDGWTLWTLSGIASVLVVVGLGLAVTGWLL